MNQLNICGILLSINSLLESPLILMSNEIWFSILNVQITQVTKLISSLKNKNHSPSTKLMSLDKRSHLVSEYACVLV